jgi:FHS family L-fucose permease-like MFS transporter
MLPPTTHAKEREAPGSRNLIPTGMAMPFFLVTGLFFLWGVPNNLNDVLIRQFMKSFAISRFQAGLIQSAFYLGYFLLATPAALLMRRFGYKFGFLAGLGLFSTGCFLFWPAALIGRYGPFLLALFVIAMGLSFLETASNPYIAQMGGQGGAARRLNLAQAFNPLGSIAGVLVGTIFIFSGIELTPAQTASMRVAGTYTNYLHHETMRVVVPYLVIGAVALAWAVLIGLTRFPSIASEHEGLKENHGKFRELLGYPHFMLAVVTQFLYVGAQVGTWSYFIQYVQDSTRQPERTAGYFLTGTLAAFGIGRFVSAAIMKRVRPDQLMAAYAVVNAILVTIGVLFPGWIGLWSIFLTSFFMSVMYPTIFALGIEGLGRNTKIGGSIIVMSIVGGAVLTPVMGLIAQSHRISVAYVVPLVCYLFVLFYSTICRRLAHQASASARVSVLEARASRS